MLQDQNPKKPKNGKKCWWKIKIRSFIDKNYRIASGFHSDRVKISLLKNENNSGREFGIEVDAFLIGHYSIVIVVVSSLKFPILQTILLVDIHNISGYFYPIRNIWKWNRCQPSAKEGKISMATLEENCAVELKKNGKIVILLMNRTDRG